MPRKGLGKGLASLIPEVYDEGFDSNSTQSLDDILNNRGGETPEEEDNSGEEKKNIFEEIEEEEKDIPSGSDEEESEEIPEKESDEIQEEEVEEENTPSEDSSTYKDLEESTQTTQEIQVNDVHVEEVKEIVKKNPRITLWSARSSAVFRYLRKTEPEFSISKEASTLIDEAVSKKYPEIWELFDDY